MPQAGKIPQATGAPLTTAQLDRLTQTARDVIAGRATSEGVDWLCLYLVPCLEELQDYRRRAAASLELEPDTTNVIALSDRVS